MDHSFRIRINRSPTDTIQSDANELVLPTKGLTQPVILRARQNDIKICDSDQLAIVGSGFASAMDAEYAARGVRKALTVALARVRVGADFGDRAAKSMFTSPGLKWVEGQIGQRALNDVHGLMVFETYPKPRFASTNARFTRGAMPEVFLSAFERSVDLAPELSQREELSYLLFNASFFQPTADSRFLLLVMAVEALIEPESRSQSALSHVDSLIAQTKNADIPEREKHSMLGTLRWLRVESINQAGRRVANERLGGNTYLQMSPADFFTHCYQARSNLVHGNIPAPAFEMIGNIASTLEVFVSELLTNPILGCSQQIPE